LLLLIIGFGVKSFLKSTISFWSICSARCCLHLVKGFMLWVS